MYSVFLVDDEPILLEGIRSKIDWDSIGLNFVGEATDGEIALSMMQEIKPDILITDVKMPFMDGLELSSAIKKIFFKSGFCLHQHFPKNQSLTHGIVNEMEAPSPFFETISMPFVFSP